MNIPKRSAKEHCGIAYVTDGHPIPQSVVAASFPSELIGNRGVMCIVGTCLEGRKPDRLE